MTAVYQVALEIAKTTPDLTFEQQIPHLLPPPQHGQQVHPIPLAQAQALRPN